MRCDDEYIPRRIDYSEQLDMLTYLNLFRCVSVNRYENISLDFDRIFSYRRSLRDLYSNLRELDDVEGKLNHLVNTLKSILDKNGKGIWFCLYQIEFYTLVGFQYNLISYDNNKELIDTIFNLGKRCVKRMRDEVEKEHKSMDAFGMDTTLQDKNNYANVLLLYKFVQNEDALQSYVKFIISNNIEHEVCNIDKYIINFVDYILIVCLYSGINELPMCVINDVRNMVYSKYRFIKNDDIIRYIIDFIKNSKNSDLANEMLSKLEDNHINMQSNIDVVRRLIEER